MKKYVLTVFLATSQFAYSYFDTQSARDSSMQSGNSFNKSSRNIDSFTGMQQPIMFSGSDGSYGMIHQNNNGSGYINYNDGSYINFNR